MVFSWLAKKKVLSLFKKHIYFSLVIASVLCFLIYTEVISYAININNWFHLQCVDQSKCLKILLVADPQITGHEKSEAMKYLAQYDGDSYLRKTYLHAYNFVQPNITIFLGDLMDEGSTATNKEYDEYVQRFFNIFSKQGTEEQIWLPGDNDIGGEGMDRVTPHKIKRFQKFFSQANMLEYGKVTFIKVNQLDHSFPDIKSKVDFYNTSRITVMLSHVPLMFTPSVFVEKVFSKVRPHVIFTAHEHKAMILTTDAFLRQDRQIVPQNPEDTQVYQFQLGINDLYEIMVPTCSYRMGTTKIGFGFAILENERLQYTILWSLSRFPQLNNYILMLWLIVVSFILMKIFQLLYSKYFVSMNLY